MGRYVNVVLPSGRVVAVPEDVATASQLSTDTQAQMAAQEEARLNAERSEGFVEGAKAFGEGALDTASFGLYGAGRELLDPEGAETMRIRAQERGGMRFLGEAATLGVGAASMAGRLGGAAADVAGLTAPGLARRAGQAIGGLKGEALEGAVLGVGGYVSSTNVTGDPLTIESAVASATLGGVLDVGFNVAANKLEGVVWGLKRTDAELARVRELLPEAKKGKAIFDDTPPSWNEFVDLHEARKKAVSDYNKQVAKEAREYDDFWSSNADLTKAINETDAVLEHVRNDVYQKQGGPFAGTPERVRYDIRDGKVVGADTKFESGRMRVDFKGGEAGEVRGPMGEQFPTAGQPQLRTLIYDADGRPVISDATIERIKEYRARVSQIYQKKAGGWKMDKGKWIRDESVLPDPRGAMEDLRALQTEIMGRYSKASGMMKTALPNPPRTPLAEIPGELPKSIEDFARKHMDQINQIANSVNDPQMAGALERVMKDLDLLDPTKPRSAAENLGELHRSLRDYRAKVGEMDALEAKAKAQEEKMPGLLKWIHRAARYVGGRAVDTGGAWGAVRRQIGGTAVVKGMTAVEGAVGIGAKQADHQALNAMLLQERMGMKQRIRGLITKYGVPTADLARKLGSPLAYLSTSFPSGEKDKEMDPRKQAIHRIHELQTAAMAAPDAAFLAVQGMLGVEGDIAWKMHQHIVGSLNYLMSTLPRDPGTDTKMFQSHWTPQYHEAVALAHRLEAVSDPLTAIARAIAGNSHPAATEALWAVYPSIMNELAQELSVAAPSLKNLTYEQASAYSNLFRTPLTGLQQPVVVMTIQGLYMKGSQATAPQTAGPAGGGAKKAPGRPAAVQSSVAGSSVANLTE